MMVVCKFFLQGECKFGESCRFDHQFPTGNISAPQNQQLFRNQNQIFSVKPANEVDTNTLITSVHNDMVSVEKSGQWLLTCYAPFKEKSIFPGFEDQSFEEIRLGFYKAQQTNSLEQYNQQLQQALVNAKAKFKALQNPNKEIVELLRNIYNTQFTSPASNLSNQNSVFGNNITSGLPPNNVFGNTAPTLIGSQNSGSLFGQNFGQNQKSQMFGQSNVSQNTNSIFGQPNKGSLFGNNNVSQGLSVFGRTVPYVSKNFSNAQKILTDEGFMFHSPYSFEENRFYFLESLRIFENVVQNVGEQEDNSRRKSFEFEESDSSQIDTETPQHSSNPFRAKSSYFKESQPEAEKLESPFSELCIKNSMLPGRSKENSNNETNWLLKYVMNRVKEMEEEQDRLLFKIELLNQENRIFRDEINKLKSIKYRLRKPIMRLS